jgi:hypothetical protein
VFLIDPETTSTPGVSVGTLLLVVAAAIGAVTARGANGRAGLLWPGVAGAMVMVLYVVSMYRLASTFDVGGSEYLGYGVYVSAAGCLTAIAGAMGHPRR